MVQVFFVMLFFPVVMNALQYYIIDGFIKDQKPADHEPVPSEDPDEDDEADPGRSRRRRLRDTLGEDEGLDSEDEDITKTGETAKAAEVSDKACSPDRVKKLEADQKLDEYDPAIDGERGGSSGSSTRSRGENNSPPKVDADGNNI